MTYVDSYIELCTTFNDDAATRRNMAETIVPSLLKYRKSMLAISAIEECRTIRMAVMAALRRLRSN